MRKADRPTKKVVKDIGQYALLVGIAVAAFTGLFYAEDKTTLNRNSEESTRYYTEPYIIEDEKVANTFIFSTKEYSYSVIEGLKYKVKNVSIREELKRIRAEHDWFLVGDETKIPVLVTLQNTGIRELVYIVAYEDDNIVLKDSELYVEGKLVKGVTVKNNTGLKQFKLTDSVLRTLDHVVYPLRGQKMLVVQDTFEVESSLFSETSDTQAVRTKGLEYKMVGHSPLLEQSE